MTGRKHEAVSEVLLRCCLDMHAIRGHRPKHKGGKARPQVQSPLPSRADKVLGQDPGTNLSLHMAETPSDNSQGNSRNEELKTNWRPIIGLGVSLGQSRSSQCWVSILPADGQSSCQAKKRCRGTCCRSVCGSRFIRFCSGGGGGGCGVWACGGPHCVACVCTRVYVCVCMWGGLCVFVNTTKCLCASTYEKCRRGRVRGIGKASERAMQRKRSVVGGISLNSQSPSPYDILRVADNRMHPTPFSFMLLSARKCGMTTPISSNSWRLGYQ